MKYCKPTFESIATFKKDTKGLWTGKFRDVFGGRALIKVTVVIHSSKLRTMYYNGK